MRFKSSDTAGAKPHLAEAERAHNAADHTLFVRVGGRAVEIKLDEVASGVIDTVCPVGTVSRCTSSAWTCASTTLSSSRVMPSNQLSSSSRRNRVPEKSKSTASTSVTESATRPSCQV